MGAPVSYYNRRGQLVAAEEVTATDAKNRFGAVLDRVNREGAVAIIKHDETCAVVLSVDVFRALTAPFPSSIGGLTLQFDDMLERMQRPLDEAARERLFSMSSAKLGRLAVSHAETTRKIEKSYKKPKHFPGYPPLPSESIVDAKPVLGHISTIKMRHSHVKSGAHVHVASKTGGGALKDTHVMSRKTKTATTVHSSAVGSKPRATGPSKKRRRVGG